jgi:DnaJ-class molecular chaperone
VQPALGHDFAWRARLNEQDYYAVLEIRRDATPEEVKSAYHALAAFYHTDHNPGKRMDRAAKKIVLINEAYEVLRDPKQREA